MSRARTAAIVAPHGSAGRARSHPVDPHRVDQRGDGVRLMTSQEAADRLCMSHEWLRKKVQRREVPFVRLGRYVRFTDAHLTQIVEAATQPVPHMASRRSARTKL